MSVGGISLSSALHGGRAFDVRRDVPVPWPGATRASNKPTQAQVSMTVHPHCGAGAVAGGYQSLRMSSRRFILCAAHRCVRTHRSWGW